MRGTGSILIAALVLTLAPLALAQPAGQPRAASLASERFRMALDEFRAGHFAQAAVDFEAAYDTMHEPSLLFNIGTAKYEANDLVGAQRAFEQYLQFVPNAPNRGIVEGRLSALRQRLAVTPTNASSAPQVAQAAASPQPTSARTVAWAGGGVPVPAVAILVGGGVVLIASAVTYALSRSALSSCTETPSEWVCSNAGAASDANLYDNLTTGGLVIGGLALAAGVVVFLVTRHRTETVATRPFPHPWAVTGPGGAILGFEGRF